MNKGCACIECIYREAAGVSKSIKYFLAFGIFTKQFPILSLINKETGLLPRFVVNNKIDSVLDNNSFIRFSQKKLIYYYVLMLLAHCFSALVINAMQSFTINFFYCFGYIMLC